jgi:hypothetical protein
MTAEAAAIVAIRVARAVLDQAPAHFSYFPCPKAHSNAIGVAGYRCRKTVEYAYHFIQSKAMNGHIK